MSYGEERASRRIARAIVEARRRRPIETTGELRADRESGLWERIGAADRIRRRAPSRRCESR